ncbi:MAG: DUF2934 domain-containing protein [bacterium]
MESKSTTKKNYSKKSNAALQEDIFRRINLKAYELFEQRGCTEGDDWADWLKAEEIVMRDYCNPLKA